MSSLMWGSSAARSTRSDLRKLPGSAGGLAASAAARSSSTGRTGWIRKIPGPRARPVVGKEPRADHHFAARRLELVEDARNVARVVLAVAVHADHVFESQLIGELVPGLHATAQAQVVGQRQHL